MAKNGGELFEEANIEIIITRAYYTYQHEMAKLLCVDVNGTSQ